LAVSVPMMDGRPMRMRMDNRLMIMRMRMSKIDRLAFVDMTVVPIIMLVRVCMHCGFMTMVIAKKKENSKRLKN